MINEIIASVIDYYGITHAKDVRITVLEDLNICRLEIDELRLDLALDVIRKIVK